MRNDHFYALGLQPGASPSEIKAAFRRLAKLYHPDHDRSLDAEVKYKEIRAAYEALRDWHLAGGKSAEPATHASKDWTSGRTVWASEDWATEYDVDLYELATGIKKNTERIPFSLANLPAIFVASLKELANAGVVLQVLLAAYFISLSYAPSFSIMYESSLGYIRTSDALQARPFKNLVWVIAFTSGLVVIVLRYYVTLRRKGTFFCTFIVCSYATAVTLIVNLFYPVDTMAFTGLWGGFSLASIILVLNPLGTLYELISFFLRGLFERT